MWVGVPPPPLFQHNYICMHTIVKVIYTNRKLTAWEAAEQKRYDFLCDEYSVKRGDMIKSPIYQTLMEVVDVRQEKEIPEDPRGYGRIKSLPISEINGKSVREPFESKDSKMNSTMMSGMMGKWQSQFVPVKEKGVKMSFSGLLCVPVDGEYVGIDKDNNLVSFPEEFTIDIPVYSINKVTANLKPGDIIKNGNSYSKLLSINPDGSLKTLSFTGYSHNKKAVQDFLLGTATTRVLINMFNFDNSVGFNPIMFAMANGDKIDVQELFMLSMLPQGKDLFSNAGGGFNPMMLWMLDKNGGGDEMFKMFMMSQMMGQMNQMGNPFSNMFGFQQQPQSPSVGNPVPPTQTVS